MAEHLDGPLPLDHLLDVAVHGSQVLLLPGVVPSRHGTEPRCHEQHHRRHRDGEERERDVQNDHAEKGHDQCRQGVQELRQDLVHELAQGVDVVRVDGHDVPVGVGIEIADGQGLHMAEQVDPNPSHGALADVDHQAVVHPREEHAEERNERELQQRGGQRPEIGTGRCGQRKDVVVGGVLDFILSADIYRNIPESNRLPYNKPHNGLRDSEQPWELYGQTSFQ